MNLEEYECPKCGDMTLMPKNITGKRWFYCPYCNSTHHHYSKRYFKTSSDKGEWK